MSLGGDLLDREAEAAAITGLLDAAASGDGGALLLQGEAGIGKTAQLAAACELAEGRGFSVLRARGAVLEREFAFGVVRQLFERRLAAEPELFAGAAALAAPVFPGAAVQHAPAEDAWAALHGLYWLAANMADRDGPLAVAVDDGQWADLVSLRFLVYLSRRLEGLPIALLVSVRVGEPDAPSELLEALEAEPLALAPLSGQGSAALVRRGLDAAADATFCAACHAAARGNPLLLVELARSLADDGVRGGAADTQRLAAVGPESVARWAMARVARLGDEAVAFAGAVALLGDDADLSHAAALANVSAERAAAVADELAAAAILEPATPRFVHPLVRAAIYDSLGAASRRAAHRRAAALLDQRGAPAERVAAQLLEADGRGEDWAVQRLRAAAAEAIGRGAPDAALPMLRRALVEPPGTEQREAVLRELGHAELLTAEPAGIGHLLEARDLSTDPVERAEIALVLARAMVPVAEFQHAGRLLEAALAENHGADRELTLMLEAELAAVVGNLPERPALLERFEERARELAGETPAERNALACLAHLIARRGGRAGDVERYARRALADGRMLADQGPGSPMVLYLLGTLIWSEAFELAAQETARLTEHARQAGSVSGVSAAAAAATAALRRGETADAAELARDCIARSREAGWPAFEALAMSPLIDALADRGEFDVAAAELARFADAPPLGVTIDFMLASRGRLRVMSGDVEAGLADLLGVGERQIAGGFANPAICPWRSEAALAHLRLGNRDEALRLAGEEVEHAERFEAPRALGIALRVRGLCARGDAQLDWLERGAAVLDRSQARLEHARALVDLGSALRRTNHRTDSRGPLRQGMELAHRCGAAPLTERAMEELKATGARPRRLVSTGVDALTASERRVAAMAAEGRSNVEIAQALFVTVKTVESHLRHVYIKLGITSRRELAAALA